MKRIAEIMEGGQVVGIVHGPDACDQSAKAGSVQRLVRRKQSRRWRSSFERPPRRGWYECKARDDRWGGKTQWRAWGCGMWWIPLGKGDGSDGWLSSPMGIYQWRGPAHDVMGPPPNSVMTEMEVHE